MRVHSAMGPGLLESAYEKCLAIEFDQERLPFARQAPLSIQYNGVHIEPGYVPDFIIANELVLEIKSVETILPVHKAQLLTYLRLSGCRVGLLINFHTARLTHGIRRCVL